MSYNPKVYRKQGGAEFVVASGGTLTVQSGGTLAIASGATISESQYSGKTTVAADVLAIPITHGLVTKTTGADGEALTLANGVPGQRLVITLGTDGGGDGTLTPTTASGFVSIVFADAGDTVSLRFVDATTGWVIDGAFGATAQPAINLS